MTVEDAATPVTSLSAADSGTTSTYSSVTIIPPSLMHSQIRNSNSIIQLCIWRCSWRKHTRSGKTTQKLIDNQHENVAWRKQSNYETWFNIYFLIIIFFIYSILFD